MTDTEKMYTPPSPEHMKAVESYLKSFSGGALIKPSAITAFNRSTMMNAGRRMRKSLENFPLLSGAQFQYVDIAVSREWAMTGSPASVSRAVEYMNNAEVRDYDSGLIYKGYDEVLRRRVSDELIVGETAYLVENMGTSEQGPLQYVDPTELYLKRHRLQDRYIRPQDEVWQYLPLSQDRELLFKNKDVFLRHRMPIGYDKFVSPFLLLWPIATIEFLLNDHDTASMDGRKLRDIFLVNTPLFEAVQAGIAASLAQYQENGTGKLGIPMIPINALNVGMKMEDQFAILQLSRIPEKFDPDAFYDRYANLIQAILGLAIRHFWNGSTARSNRSLEVVQEARQQQKGPASFIRSEQRLINNSGMLRRFDTTRHQTRLNFIEEVDLATKKANADVMAKNAGAFKSILEVLPPGTKINVAEFDNWMKSLGLIPYEIQMFEYGEQTFSIENPDDQVANGDETTEADQPQNTAQAKSLYSEPDYGEITMKSDGTVIDTRRRVFSIDKILQKTLKVNDYGLVGDVPEVETTIEENVEFETGLLESLKSNVYWLKDRLTDSPEAIEGWTNTQKSFPVESVQQLLERVKNNSNEEFTDDELFIVNTIACEIDLE